MQEQIDAVLDEFEAGRLSRRQLAGRLAALSPSPHLDAGTWQPLKRRRAPLKRSGSITWRCA